MCIYAANLRDNTLALRGAEAPLFHGTACIPEFFCSLSGLTWQPKFS